MSDMPLPSPEQTFSILNMRSRSSDDATTRSRIRDAALLLFGRAGYHATTVRAIATEAGVSAGLVIHHFGTKERLRDACDDEVVREIVGDAASLGESDLGATIEEWLADSDTFRPALDYLVRMLTDGTDAGGHLFDQLVARTERMLAEGSANGSMHGSSDPRVLAVVVASYGLMPLLLEKHVNRALGQPMLTAEGMRRLSVPVIELYTNGLFRGDARLTAAKAALAPPVDGNRVETKGIPE